ncbi:MAG: hypothetical protein WDO16_20975 [Bacteroidota bacterium]
MNGVSYSYLDIRFYGKATMTGSFVKTSKNFRIKEIRTVEVKTSTGGGTCIMNYDLVYSKSGKEEFLEGTYLGKQEVKGMQNTYEWAIAVVVKYSCEKYKPRIFILSLFFVRPIQPHLFPKKIQELKKPARRYRKKRP